MAKRWGRAVVNRGTRAAAGLLCGVGLLGASWACSSGGTSEPANEGSSGEPRADEPLDPSRAEPDSSEVVYQFVDTPNGMTVEAASGGAVQTQSCPTRTCAGFCDECAVRACLALGQLTAACERLADDCMSACSCDALPVPGSRCGFPVCTTNRNLCYIGDGSSEPAVPPEGPDRDPSPIRPEESSSPESSAPASSSPSSSGAAASRPAG